MAALTSGVIVTCSTFGAGPLGLGAAVAPYLSPAAGGAVSGSRYLYTVSDLASGASEYGRGTWTAGGVNGTLTRAPLWSTNGGATIVLSGSAHVTLSSDESDFLLASQTRTLLTTATTFYVATNGSDANDGKTPATAWATFAHAMAVLAGQYDFGGQTVTLQAVAGHAAFTTILNITPWVGGGSFVYDGGGGSIVVPGQNPCLNIGSGPCPGTITIQNVTLSTPTGGAISMTGYNQLFIGTGVVFGAVAFAHFNISRDAQVFVLNSYTISGGAGQHFSLAEGGLITNEFASNQVNITANMSFGTFALVSDSVLTFVNAVFALNGHAVTGTKFVVLSNGIIQTNTNQNYFPGTANSGQTASGGQYS